MKRLAGNNNFLSLLFFSALWLSILMFSGSILSGYHLTDDHEIVRIKNDLSQNNSIVETSKKWITSDIEATKRFRPFFYVHRIVETKIFGSHFILWSFYNCILAIATSWLIFRFIVFFGLGVFESIFLSLLALLGPQATIWWKLGNNETIGMVFLALVLYFLIKKSDPVKNKKIYNILFIISAFLMSLSKESFIIFIPAIAFIDLYVIRIRDSLSWLGSLRKNIVDTLLLALIFILEISLIVFYTGVGGVGYAGIEKFEFFKYFKTFIQLLFISKIYIPLVLIAVLGFVFIKIKSRTEIREILKTIYPAIVLFALIMLPQTILYAKSGVLDRYIVPGILGSVFFMVFLLRYINERVKILSLKYLLLVGLLICTIYNTHISFARAKTFAIEGQRLNYLFDSIGANTEKDSKLLIVADPAYNYEHLESIGYYLKYELNKENIYLYPLMIKDFSKYSDFEKQLMAGAGESYGKYKYESIEKRENIDSIIIFPRLEKKFIENMSNDGWFNEELYNRNDFDNYIVYYKK